MRHLRVAFGLALVISVALPSAIAADSVVYSWPVGEEPFGIAVDPSDGRIFVANSKEPSGGQLGPGSITVVDPTSSLTRTIVTSGPADLLAIDASHRRLYSSNADHSLQVFDLDTLTLIARVPVGGLGLAVDASTQRIYVADYVFPGGTFVAVIDGATNTVVQTKFAPTPENWFGLALDPELHHLYVTNTNYYWSPTTPTLPSLVVLDDRDLSLVSDIQLSVVPRFAIAVDQTQHRVYVGAADPNALWGGSMFLTLDGSSFATLASTSTPGFPLGIALDPGAHRIYLTDACHDCQFHGYRVLDDRTYGVVQTVATPWFPGLPLVHPDGRLYIGAWNLFVDDLVAIRRGNTAPEIVGLWFTPPDPRTNDTLVINVTAVDRDLIEVPPQQPITLAYEWLRNGVVITNATGSTLDLSVAGVGQRGDTIAVNVTVSDGSLSTTETASVVVANTPLTAVAVTLSDATPMSHDILVALAAADDADGDAIYTYTWSVNGTVRRVVSTSGPDSFDLGVKGNGDNGDVVTVSVVASDGVSSTPTTSASATVTPGRHK